MAPGSVQHVSEKLTTYSADKVITPKHGKI